MKTRKYYCPRCKNVMDRERKTLTFLSYCSTTGRKARVWRIR